MVYFLTPDASLVQLDLSIPSLPETVIITKVEDFVVDTVNTTTLTLLTCGGQVMRDNKSTTLTGDGVTVEHWTTIVKVSDRLVVSGWRQSKQQNILFLLDSDLQVLTSLNISCISVSTLSTDPRLSHP